MASIACPRCGHVDTFTRGFLPETCVCRVCQSQLDWREIPGMGADCRPLADPREVAAAGPAGGPERAGAAEPATGAARTDEPAGGAGAAAAPGTGE